MTGRKPYLNKKYILKIVILCKRSAIQWQKGTWSPTCIFLSLPFLPSANLAFILSNIVKFLKMIAGKVLLVAFGCDGPDARDPTWMRAIEDSPSVFLHFDVLKSSMPRVMALNFKGTLSVLETKAVIAIQWRHKLLHVQPSPIGLARELNEFDNLCNDSFCSFYCLR